MYLVSFLKKQIQYLKLIPDNLITSNKFNWNTKNWPTLLYTNNWPTLLYTHNWPTLCTVYKQLHMSQITDEAVIGNVLFK